MTTSEQINEVSKAYVAASAELKNPPFDSNNPAFRSKYASLASVRDTVIPVLAKHGLSVIQNVSSTDNIIRCTNRLIHSSGQWMESDPFEIPADKHNAHGYGSACTYARRFSLMALVAVVGDEDDDGNAAVAATPPPTPKFKHDMKVIESFQKATTLDEVAAAWNAIDKAQQVHYKEIKDAAKAKVQGAADA